MPTKSPVVHSVPEILSGTPVFVGTRVPVQSLLDYLEAGDTLHEFLRQFPSVRREQAIAALELARESVVEADRRDAACETSGQIGQPAEKGSQEARERLK